MPDIDEKIAKRVDEFVAELRDMVRAAALEAVTEALEQTSPGRRRRAGTKNGHAMNGRSKSAGLSRKRRGSRRSTEDISEQASAIHNYLGQHPEGKRADEISTDLGISTGELVLPIKMLLAEKSIRRTGNRRSTTYFKKKKR